jgi:hypothetical protein
MNQKIGNQIIKGTLANRLLPPPPPKKIQYGITKLGKV